MLQQPDVLLLDEPTAGVDAGFGDTIYSLIRRVQTERGMTILLISHDLSVVYRYAQNVVCLNKSHRLPGPARRSLESRSTHAPLPRDRLLPS
jgi:ABC-type Mn2+/Zn2+ transport system ATPase subunit